MFSVPDDRREGGGEKAKANESTFYSFARTAFPQMQVLGRDRERKSKSEDLTLLLQVPPVSYTVK